MSRTRRQCTQRVHDFAESVHSTGTDGIADVLEEHYHPDANWQGPAPFDELNGRAEIREGYWEPLLDSFPDLEQNDYILFGGEFRDNTWVCAAGNFVGTFENDWLDIPATGHATWLRHGTFHRFEDGKIAETRLFVDVLDVMRQAGFRFVPALAPEVVAPAPATADGILLDDADAGETEQTQELVEGMIFEGLESYEDEGLEGMGMEEYWHEDFMWYGPAGIGSTRGIDGFQAYHQQPFLEAFPDRGADSDDIRVAEGTYAAWTGWPSLKATHLGDGWLGLPATGESVEMRVMDFWRREGDLLAENWVFIDMIDLLEQLGVDVFERLRNDQQYF
ncbi:ester cyclase [Halobellus ordinarius]|uniref:ester cyclase n=1 Tax=Halobellus ordinarius TaxID=3075120 RepID=UPI002880A50F|nr:ester cyclase [Halobellus sp. ZY16]